MNITKQLKEFLEELYSLDGYNEDGEELETSEELEELLAKLEADLQRIPIREGVSVYLFVGGNGDEGSPPNIYFCGTDYVKEGHYPALESLILLVADEFVPGYDCDNGAWAELGLTLDADGVWDMELRTHYN